MSKSEYHRESIILLFILSSGLTTNRFTAGEKHFRDITFEEYNDGATHNATLTAFAEYAASTLTGEFFFIIAITTRADSM